MSNPLKPSGEASNSAEAESGNAPFGTNAVSEEAAPEKGELELSNPIADKQKPHEAEEPSAPISRPTLRMQPIRRPNPDFIASGARVTLSRCPAERRRRGASQLRKNRHPLTPKRKLS